MVKPTKPLKNKPELGTTSHWLEWYARVRWQALELLQVSPSATQQGIWTSKEADEFKRILEKLRLGCSERFDELVTSK